MNMKPRFRITRTYEWINYTCLVIGLLVIWFSTHSFLGLLGGVIAALRYQEITVVTPDRYAEFHAEQM